MAPSGKLVCSSCSNHCYIQIVNNSVFSSLQIIKRARQNYLMQQYIAADLSLTQMAEDTKQALQVSSVVVTG